jgi:hypothetical protein
MTGCPFKKYPYPKNALIWMDFNRTKEFQNEWTKLVREIYV